jgi:hypothetical protein
MMQYAEIGDDVYFWFAANTTAGTAGDGETPLFDVRLAGAAANAAPTASGTPTLLTHADYPDGIHEIKVDTDAFAAGEYAVFCSLTISDVNPAGFCGAFKLRTAGTAALNVNATHVGGTLQTGRDIGASVLLSSGTGTGQLDFTSGVVKSNLVQILASALSGTAAQIAAAFVKFFDKAAPTGTVNSLPDAVPGANGGLPTTNGTKINQTVDLVAGQIPTADAIGTDAASKVLATPAQKLVTDASGYVTYSNAAPPSAADVKTAMEANGSKLDHLWEMTEDDGGVRRLTTNALEQAPTGGSAPSAASIADAVWDEAIADHTTATTFGGKNQKGVPSETVNDYKATGFSTHTAADVKTAMEAVGSHLALTKTAVEAIDTLTKASGSGDLARALVILEKIYKSAATIVEGAAAVGTLSTTEMTTTLTEATDDHYNGRVIIFSSGVLANQATDITDYDGATKKLTFTAVTEAPTAADTFVIV